jgi:hypothetical protein
VNQSLKEGLSRDKISELIIDELESHSHTETDIEKKKKPTNFKAKRFKDFNKTVEFAVSQMNSTIQNIPAGNASENQALEIVHKNVESAIFAINAETSNVDSSMKIDGLKKMASDKLNIKEAQEGKVVSPNTAAANSKRRQILPMINSSGIDSPHKLTDLLFDLSHSMATDLKHDTAPDNTSFALRWIQTTKTNENNLSVSGAKQISHLLSLRSMPF